ncbi:hypothetical protein [Streptomyces cahuitamycinicus]|uniref:Uncharacterized protein n=1 Tax=Streptomyces cahuitamycinicus TaxID=2070367 RepID=A0A2N8TK86_9ACTN|nr:hypothetical protein [Streptomyces cahuitamycinicus]PNG19427.1 hypothetical protein C1J00_25715 [Streptomyces cahuitamycinicus]
MTVSDATPHNPIVATSNGRLAIPEELLTEESSIGFTIGPEYSPVQAMDAANSVVAMSLPNLLKGVPDAAQACADVHAVLTELVDITTRHRASADLVGKVVFDGFHVTVSVGDMSCSLPTPEVEPGLYLVHGTAQEVGQHDGDAGGRVTWAAVAVRR